MRCDGGHSIFLECLLSPVSSKRNILSNVLALESLKRIHCSLWSSEGPDPHTLQVLKVRDSAGEGGCLLSWTHNWHHNHKQVIIQSEGIIRAWIMVGDGCISILGVSSNLKEIGIQHVQSIGLPSDWSSSTILACPNLNLRRMAASSESDLSLSIWGWCLPQLSLDAAWKLNTCNGCSTLITVLASL
jgi:hypothetical protein